MEEGGKNLARGLISALQKLKQVAQLPNEQTLFNWGDVDIEIHNAYGNCGGDSAIQCHVRRDHDSMIMLQEQNAILVGPGDKFSTPCELALVNLVVYIGTQLAVCNKF